MLILIAGKQAALRKALKRFLQSRSESEVVGMAPNKTELLHLIETTSPELLLLDENLAKNLVQEIIVPVRERDPALLIIVVGSQQGRKQAYVDAGAAAFVNKNASPKNLLTAIEELRLRGDGA